MSGRLLLRDVEIDGRAGFDCRLCDGQVSEVGVGLAAKASEAILDGNRGALIPGLADHHVHLLSLAAAQDSVDLSAADRSQSGLRDALAQAVARQPSGEWIRAIEWDEVTHGDLDRWRLDQWVPTTPVRVQHRSGALWVINSAASDLLDAEATDRPGIERDAQGRVTGRLWREDQWLSAALGPAARSLENVSSLLASFGVTHVSDASPDPDGTVAQAIGRAIDDRSLRQHVQVMGQRHAPDPWRDLLRVGPRKIIISDHELPALAEVIAEVQAARLDDRCVAVHCVTREALLLTIAALQEVGLRDGDRIEHCAVAPAETLPILAHSHIRVVTQPSLVARRGDDYSQRVDPRDMCDLWRYQSLIAAGVRVAASSDAPYGDPDPWTGLRAATDRRTASGRTFGPAERVSPQTVMRGLISDLHDPGGQLRRVCAGAAADLVLLDRPLREALRDRDKDCVLATFIDGDVIYARETSCGLSVDSRAS